MELYTCVNCGYDVGGNPSGVCPNCKVDLSGISCLGCAYSGPRKIFTTNNNKCPKCGALLHIPDGPAPSLVKINSARPVVLSISNGAITVWPLLMYFTGILFLIAANAVLFMSYDLEIESKVTYFLIMIAFSLGVIALNTVIIGGLVASIAEDLFSHFNQKIIIAIIYLASLVLICITGYLFLYIDIGTKTTLTAMPVIFLSWGGSIGFTVWLRTRSVDEIDALQAQVSVVNPPGFTGDDPARQ